MSELSTVLGSYNATRGRRDGQDQRANSADPNNLMQGRTFIPRMSEENKKLLIEGLQKAKKKRQERLDSREKAKIDERTRPSLIAAEEKTKDLMSQMSGLPQDRKLTNPKEKPAYNDSKRKNRHLEIQRNDNKLREEKEKKVFDTETFEKDLSDAKSRQRRSLSPPFPHLDLMNAINQLPEGTIQGAVEQGISPAIDALKSLARGGKIPQYKKRTIKYRK